jgi:hypothetical protein
MKKKNWILTSLVAFLVAAGFLTIAFSSYASAQKQKNSSTCCQKQKMKECTGNVNTTAPGGMIPENLSRQFLLVSPFGH